MNNELSRLQELVHLSTELAKVKDFDVLMQRILKAARDFFNCDAGSIYIKKDDYLKFSYTQNDTLRKRLPPGQKLIYNTFTVPINNKSIAGYVALTGEMLNIPDAYNLDASLPFQFDKSFDENAQYRTLSILTLPLATSTKPIARASSRQRSNSSGGTKRLTGKCCFEGCRYCPKVNMRQPVACRSVSVRLISSAVSPRPSINPDLLGVSGRRRPARASSCKDLL